MLRSLGSNAAASVAGRLRALGAIAHFDPSWGATDDGSTSTWVDRIGGYSVASTSQATRMTYAASVAGLNGRPGWNGVAASSTKLVSSNNALADRIDGAVACTMYVVHKASATGATAALAGIGSTLDASFAYLFQGAGVGIIGYSRGQAGASTSNNGAVQVGTGPCVSRVVYTGAVGSIWQNGSVGFLSAANTRAGTCNRFVVGAVLTNNTFLQFLDGTIADIVIFLGAHSTETAMLVEQLLATKYAWPVLKGVSGFSAANYPSNPSVSAGIRGSTLNGVWVDVLMRPDEIPATTQVLQTMYAAATGMGSFSTAAALTFFAQNGVSGVNSPVRTLVAADVGKLMLHGGTAGPGNFVRGYVNGAQVGAGTALTGYAASNAVRYDVGQRLTASPASSFTLFGIAGGDVEQTTANQAARAAAIKAAKAFVATGGATPTHGWALSRVAASYADLVGADLLSLTGTLQAAQIIVPVWPW